jgi:hypothetical protein
MKDTVARLGEQSPIATADRLQVDLIPFRDAVQRVTRRGKMVLALMEEEGADPMRLVKEREQIDREILDLRLVTTHAFQDTLTLIVRQNGL